MTQKPEEIAKAFIYQGSRLLLQLRDNKPDILYPNYWGPFGGAVDDGETPAQAMVRELQEELGWIPPQLKYLLTWEQPDLPGFIHIFATPLTVAIDQLELTEGQMLAMLTLEELIDLPVVPEIMYNLPQVIEAIASPELTTAWQALSKTANLNL